MLTAYWVILRASPGRLLGTAASAASWPAADATCGVDELLQATISAVDRAAELHPLRPRCLERAFACRWLLARHGQQAHVVVGVARRDGTLDAHAWVELQGRTNDAARPSFTTLTYLK